MEQVIFWGLVQSDSCTRVTSTQSETWARHRLPISSWRLVPALTRNPPLSQKRRLVRKLPVGDRESSSSNIYPPLPNSYGLPFPIAVSLPVYPFHEPGTHAYQVVEQLRQDF